MKELENEMLLWGMFSETPVYWQNFMRDLKFKNTDIKVSYDLLNQGLSEYHASIILLKEYIYKITFDTPEHKTWFILKWST